VAYASKTGQFGKHVFTYLIKNNSQCRCRKREEQFCGVEIPVMQLTRMISKPPS
jgi:hypothetical protein